MNFIEQKARFTQNIQTATGVLSSADSALGNASTLITRARTLGLGEIGSTATEQTRTSAATVMTEIINEMVSIGNTRFSGRYIFAGRDTLNAPFQEMLGRHLLRRGHGLRRRHDRLHVDVVDLGGRGVGVRRGVRRR